MANEEKLLKLRSISAKLSDIGGHKAMIDSLHGQAYKLCEELGIENDLGYDLGNCESEFDYENLSCNISNDEDAWLEKMSKKELSLPEVKGWYTVTLEGGTFADVYFYPRTAHWCNNDDEQVGADGFVLNKKIETITFIGE